MLRVLRVWQRRYFGEEAVVLILLLLGVFCSIALLGSVLLPIIASLILAYLMHGWVLRLQKLKIPSSVSAALFSLLLLWAMLFALFVVLPLIWEQLGRLYQELPSKLPQLREFMDKALEDYGVTLNAALLETWISIFNERLAAWSTSMVSQSVGTIVGLAQLAVYLVLVPLLVFFLLRDGSALNANLRQRMEPNGMLLNIWNEMDMQLANYVRGKAVEILLVGLASYGLFLSFGLRYTVLMSVLSGLSVLVPYVGAFALTAAVAMIGIIQWGLSDPVYYMLILYLILQIIDGNVLVPIIFSDTVSLHPVSIVLAVLVFGGLWGVWGIFFAIPMATLVKAIYSAWPRNA
jgi:putative permease